MKLDPWRAKGAAAKHAKEVVDGFQDVDFSKKVSEAREYFYYRHGSAFQSLPKCQISYLDEGLPAESIVDSNIKVVKSDSVGALFNTSAIQPMVMNFASYKNPGGMFLKGSLAQEESLCHESDLYPVLSKCTEFYRWNKKNLNSALYTNHGLVTLGVEFVRNGSRRSADVLTLAAPNFGAYYRLCGTGRDSVTTQSALIERVMTAVKIYYEHPNDLLIAGAFGCGVFRGPPDAVYMAFDFASALYSTMYCKSKPILFPVMDDRNGQEILLTHSKLKTLIKLQDKLAVYFDVKPSFHDVAMSYIRFM